MEYSDLLKHPNWQKKRLEILSRDMFTCKVCNAKEKQLHVHHFSYEKGLKPWEYPDENLTTLCLDCHAIEEEFIKIGHKSFADLSKKTKFLVSDMYCMSYLYAWLYKYHYEEFKKRSNDLMVFLKDNIDSYRNLMGELNSGNK